MKRVLFIRHGATAGNLEKRYIGRTDEPLCEAGIAQVSKLKEMDWKPDVLFVSPMLRTRQTAELVFPGMEQQIIEDLRETDFGLFEGKTAAELADEPRYQAWVDSLCRAPIPGGESIADFKARCCRAFSATIAALPEDATAAFVVNGGVIMSILEAYAQPKRSFYDYHIDNGDFLLCICHETDEYLKLERFCYS